MENLELKKFFLCLIFLVFVTEHADSATLYVSVDGNDKWSGRLSQPNKENADGPLASLTGARDAIRRLKSHKPLTEPLRVIISEGTYAMEEPFVLTAADSGTKECPISYEAGAGSRPIFTGRRVISGFNRSVNDIWQTQIPEVAKGKWYFEQLYVNGRRVIRAREPNRFYFYMGATNEVPIEQGKDVYRRTTLVRTDAIDVLKKVSSEELGDVTLVAYHKWNITKRFINGIDPAANTIITVGEKLKDYSSWDPNTRFHLENFKAALDSSGEW